VTVDAGANDYDSFAEAYAAESETNLVNAFYERRAMLVLAAEVTGRILDAGRGAGSLTAALRERRAVVTGIYSSVAMLTLAKQRLGEDVPPGVGGSARPVAVRQ
jgi:trans-aconitate methyltransferase